MVAGLSPTNWDPPPEGSAWLWPAMGVRGVPSWDRPPGSGPLCSKEGRALSSPGRIKQMLH